MKMITISLCMIVKNEEQVLARCLDSVADLVDEINIVDTGSTDKTIEIAGRYTDRVFHFKWINDFAAARNESFKYATQEYIFYMDADDVLLNEDREKFKHLKETLDPSIDSVAMYYNAGIDEYGNVTLRFRRNRLVKRTRNFQWRGKCHNYLDVKGMIINSDIAITHKKTKHAVGRTISIFKQRELDGEDFSPRDYFYYGNELRENGFYDKAIEKYNHTIESENAWIEDRILACIFQADCYRASGDLLAELKSLFKSFQFSPPRAEACSRIGYNFQVRRKYKEAIFWYELAIRQVPEPDRWSFTYLAYHTWYPHLQLCVCYYNIKDLSLAEYHNEQARKYLPDDPRVNHNRDLFKNLRHSSV